MRRFLFSVALPLMLASFLLGKLVERRDVERSPRATQRAWNTGDVLALLNRQASDWNRGNLDAFASGYKNSPDILFMGRTVSHGFDQMLASYKKGYPSREAMGTLTFAQLEVQPLNAQFATATGHFHLERTAAGGGNADGYFLLVLENTPSGWKIVRDDTTATTALPATPKQP